MSSSLNDLTAIFIFIVFFPFVFYGFVYFAYLFKAEIDLSSLFSYFSGITNILSFGRTSPPLQVVWGAELSIRWWDRGKESTPSSSDTDLFGDGHAIPDPHMIILLKLVEKMNVLFWGLEFSRPVNLELPATRKKLRLVT